jgi:hypothetical protein
MSIEKLKIPRATDKALADIFRKFGAKFGILHGTVVGITGAQIGQIVLADTPVDAWKALLVLDSCLIESMYLQLGQLSIVYSRGGSLGPDQKSPIYDELVFNFNDGHAEPSPATRLEIVAFLSEKFKRFEIGRISTSDASPEINQVLAIHQSNLERLEKLNEDLICKSVAFRESVELRFDDKVSQLEVEFKERQTAIDAQSKENAAQLQKREEALAVKLAAIDDRNNTHVRREIRDRMLDDVKQRILKFGVSEATERKRQPVIAGMLLLGGFIVLLLAWTVLEIGRANTTSFPATGLPTVLNSTSAHIALAPQGRDTNGTSAIGSFALYWLWARFAFLSLSLLATILFYIKWQNKWADQHAASEFQLQQFYVDVNRANWVIESCLEWRKETDSAIPAELLSSITNGLFINPLTEPDRVMHPADELASALMGSASKLNLKVGDSELEYDKPRKIPKKTKISEQ